MAKTEDSREQQDKTGELPEQRQQQEQAKQEQAEQPATRKPNRPADNVPDPAPKITVLGFMDGQIAIRLGWRHGMSVVSQSRFRFLRDDLAMSVEDNQDDYLF